MSKPNTRKSRLPEPLYYPQVLLLANSAFLKEYLARYLQTHPKLITITSDKKIFRLHSGPSGIQRYGGSILEMSLLAFDPLCCEPPRKILSADLQNWIDLIDSGALKLTRKAIESQYPYFALHLNFKAINQQGKKLKLNITSRVFLWLSETNRKAMKSELLQDACHFQEIYFDQQIQEICKMYGSGIAFSPSLQ